MTRVRVAIVGGGYSGTIQAIELLRRTESTVTLIERTPRLARGAAYSTRNADHLLNVRAAKMSAFADAPAHFAEWLAKLGRGDGDSFAERRLYGAYLEELLVEAAHNADGRLEIIHDEAVAIERQGDVETITLASGARVEADRVILSIGNLPPSQPLPIPPDLADGVYIGDPWAGDIAAGLRDGDNVLLIGTGLTAIDAALTLDSAGFKGQIVAVSRRGMVPRAHDRDPGPVPLLDALPGASLADLTGRVRREAGRIGWQAAVDRLRPHSQAAWASAPVSARKRFLRHLRPYWDVHRHRIAPEIGERISALQSKGRLTFEAGRLVRIARDGGHAAIVWRRRGETLDREFTAARIANCTGPRGDVERSGETLMDGLYAAGRIRPDDCRIGIDIDGACNVIGKDGRAQPSLYAIGPMTRGALWEIVAVPDIRGQADRLARQLAASN